MKHLQQLINSFNIFLISLLFWTGIPLTLTHAQTQTFITSYKLTNKGLYFSYDGGNSGGILDITIQGGYTLQDPRLYIDIYTKIGSQYHRIDPIMAVPMREDHYGNPLITGDHFFFYLKEKQLYFIDIYTESVLDIISRLSRDRDQRPIHITASWSPFHTVEKSNETENPFFDKLNLLQK